MDEGPFRMPRSADRSANNRPAVSSRSAEEPKVPTEEPKPVHRSTASNHRMKESKSKKPLIVSIVAVVVVVLAVIGGWALWSNMNNSGNAIDSSKYQAVFFTNGQVYFGKLHPFSDKYMKLTDVYYLQTKATEPADPKNPQKTADTSNDVQLIKLGDEVHGPTDEMVISKDQVLFYENLKSDGKVTASIEKFKHPN